MPWEHVIAIGIGGYAGKNFDRLDAYLQQYLYEELQLYGRYAEDANPEHRK